MKARRQLLANLQIEANLRFSRGHGEDVLELPEVTEDPGCSLRAAEPVAPSSTIREVLMELKGMVGHQVMGGMRDTASDNVVASFYGSLTELKPMGDLIMVMIDLATESGVTISPQHYTGGEAWAGGIRARFGSLELEVNRISDAAQAA